MPQRDRARIGRSICRSGIILFECADPGSGSGGRGVALSGDGNTAIVGSPDHPNTGAVQAYTRNTRGLWTPLGSVITLTPASINSFGFSVSLDTLGRTLLIGGPADSGNIGAAWVYLRLQN